MPCCSVYNNKKTVQFHNFYIGVAVSTDDSILKLSTCW